MKKSKRRITKPCSGRLAPPLRAAALGASRGNDAVKFALIEGARSEARPGTRGQCQICARDMIAKCGEVIVWHWAHSPRRLCDPWWENETEWHRRWKSYFPNDWQEVVHVDGKGEKHIADIKTDAELVVELQHSSMKPEEMRSREEFYRKMVWVVDGTPFKDSFHVLSRLPPPDSQLAGRLRILRTPSYPIDPKHPRFRITNRPMFLLDTHEIGRGENYVAYDVCSVGRGGENTYFHDRDTEAEIDTIYEGDHFLEWKRPRTVWLSACSPVLIDLGQGILWRLRQFQDKYWAVKAISGRTFVEQLGGVWSESSSG